MSESKEKFKNTGEYKNNPKLFLTGHRVSFGPLLSPRASLSVCMNATTIQKSTFRNEDCPLYFTDAQALLTNIAFPQSHANFPRWCRVVRPSKVSRILVVFCDRVTKNDVDKWEKETGQYFVPTCLEVNIEVVSPHSYGCSPESELLSIPLQFLTPMARMRSMKHLSVINGNLMFDASGAEDIDAMDPCYPNEPAQKKDSAALTTVRVTDPAMWRVSRWQSDHFPRSLLLLGCSQMSRENYPLPGMENTVTYLATKDGYDDVSDRSPMLSVDCEMVMTRNSSPLELARITIVNEDFQVLYDTLVKPDKPVTNYLTQKSGITKSLLASVTTRLKDVQMDLMELLPPDAILLGQSLNSDLHALQMVHPYCIDTSVIFNLSGVRHQKVGLKVLSAKFLNEAIQSNKRGHSSVEDSTAVMKLLKLKLRRSLEFGDVASGGWNNAELHLDREEEPMKKKLRMAEEEVEGPSQASVKTRQLSSHSDSDDDSSSPESFTRCDDRQLSDAVRRHKKFLSVHGTAPWIRPLPQLLTEAGFPTVLLDRKDQSAVSPATIESLTSFITSDKDKRRVKILPEVVRDHPWTFLRLHQHVDEDAKRISRISKLNRYIFKAYEALPPRSLMMVLCCGHPDRPSESAYCYSGLKPAPMSSCR